MTRAFLPSPRRPLAATVGATLLILAAMVGSLLVRDTPRAAATAADESSFVTALNAVRADAGLPALTVNVELSNLARGHAQVMADAGDIFHADPISAGFTGDWSRIGENVGVGSNVAVLVDAFIASPGHYANIVDPAFSQIGVGVVWKDNALYTTHRFLQPSEQAAAEPEVSATTVPPTTLPPTTTVAVDDPGHDDPEQTADDPEPAPPTTTAAPFGPPSIDAARVVTLLEMVELIGT